MVQVKYDTKNHFNLNYLTVFIFFKVKCHKEHGVFPVPVGHERLCYVQHDDHTGTIVINS